MLTKREQEMNVKPFKNNSFIRKYKYISKKSIIDFKENGNKILRKDNIEEIENDRTIQKEQDKIQKDSSKRIKTQS